MVQGQLWLKSMENELKREGSTMPFKENSLAFGAFEGHNV